ncbi:MAG: glycerophosphodiester phosphodiesterase [Lachnospiraceae bacterium]|nr:glycerophosphodiester phosphodiesterase [Lachnospiraceae bacterium]
MRKAGNIKAILLFELLYKAAFLLIAYFLLRIVFPFLLRATGYSYLTIENLVVFLKHPVTLIVIVLLLLMGALLYLLESVTLLVYYREFLKKKRVRVAEGFLAGVQETVRLLKRGGRGFLLLFAAVNGVVSLFPLLVVCAMQIQLPAYLVGTMLKQLTGIGILFVVLIVGLLFYFFGLYTLYYCVLGEYSVKESYRRSVGLVLKRPFRLVFRLLGTNLTLAAISLVIFFAALFVGCYILYRIKPVAIQNAAMLTAYSQLLFYTGILVSIAGQIVNYVALTMHYSMYALRQLPVSRLRVLQQPETEEHSKRESIAVITAFVLIVLANLFSLYHSFRNGTLAERETLFGTYITSHRGASDAAPENTLPALELAIESMADFVEIDVQETQDGVVVLMHDTNLNRTTGANALVSELTFEEIRGLEAGSWFSPDYTGTTVPTLAEVFELCKGQIALNIELKVARNAEARERLVTKVVALIEEYDMENQCVISAANLSMLELVKEQNESIKTGYILSFAYGSFYEKEYVDFFSIRSSFITESLVKRMHSYGKEVHAWTVNTETELKRMKQLGVDNIITDRPVLAREIIHGEEVSSGFVRLMKQLIQRK